MNRITSLKTGVILNWTSLVLQMAITFGLTPFIIRHLGKAGFGVWALIQSFSGYYGLINMGVTAALQQGVSRALALKDTARLQAVVGTAFTFFLATSTVILGLVAVGSAPLAAFFSIAAEDRSAFIATMLLCGVAVAADFFFALNTTLLSAKERFDLLNALNIGRQLLQAGGIVVALTIAPTTYALGCVVGAVSLLMMLVSWGVASKLYAPIRILPRGASRAVFASMVGYGSSSVLLRISNLVRIRAGNIIIAKTTGVAAVAQFSVAGNLIFNINSIIQASLNVLTPRFSKLHALNDTEEARRLLRVALFGSSTLAFGAALAVLVFGERFILFWIGPEMLAAAPIAMILIVPFAVDFAQAPGWNLMMAQARHHFMARVTAVESIATLVLGLALATHHGALGFAVATAVVILLVRLTIQPVYTSRLAEMSLCEYAAPMLVPVLTAAALYALALALRIPGILLHHGPLMFLSLGLAFAAIYLGTVWVICRREPYMPGSTQGITRESAESYVED